MYEYTDTYIKFNNFVRIKHTILYSYFNTDTDGMSTAKRVNTRDYLVSAENLNELESN